MSVAVPYTHSALAQEGAPTSSDGESLVAVEAIVRNGTQGETVPEGLIVTLQVFDRDNEDTELQRLEAETEADGVVVFDGVIADGVVVFGGVIADREVTYTISADYNGIRFFSGVYISSNERDGPLELTVFEMTPDPSVIRIIGDSSAITPPDDDSGVLRVLQVTTFENTSDRAFVGNDPFNTRLTLQLPLPAMAFDLESVHSPGSLVLAPDSREVYSIVPVMPGDFEQIVTYGVLYTTDVFAWSKTYRYPTEVARLLIPKDLSFRPGSEWVPMDDSEVSGVDYARFEMRSVLAGETVTGVVADLPPSAGSRSRSLERTLQNAALGVVAAALIIVAGFALWWSRLRNRRRQALSETENEESGQADMDAAIAELARLEDERDAGNLSEEEYERASAQHRDHLRRMLDRERNQ